MVATGTAVSTRPGGVGSIHVHHASAMACRRCHRCCGFAGTAFGPLAQLRHLAVHEFGQRHRCRDRLEDVGLPGFATFGKGFMQGIDEDRLHLRTRELIAGMGNRHGVEFGRLAPVAFDDDVPNLRPFFPI
ncbi:MAG: hypothetical protein RL117_1476, partial [Verrucomicrobiota bacterium]